MNIGAPLFFVARGPCGPQRSCLGREGTVTRTHTGMISQIDHGLDQQVKGKGTNLNSSSAA